jgi:hypothetical protein
MTTDGPPADQGTERVLALSELDDDALLGALRDVIEYYEPPPRRSVDMAKAAFGLRSVDAEVARLVSDSGLAGAPSGLRSGASSRLVVFDGADLGVEIEIEPGAQAGVFRLVGQLIPGGAARIQVRQSEDEPVLVDADDRGRFAVERLVGGPLSLLCDRDGRPATATEWISVG